MSQSEYLSRQDLLRLAKDASDNAYCPYSKVPKGAALLCADGSVYKGAAVEFATFGGSVCAELAAITAAVNAGKRDFATIAVYPAVLPCGHCRQFLREFNAEIEVVLEKPGGARTFRLPDILPRSFGPEYI